MSHGGNFTIWKRRWFYSTKPANQTYPNLVRFKQSLQLNKCLLACINLTKSSLAQKTSQTRNWTGAKTHPMWDLAESRSIYKHVCSSSMHLLASHRGASRMTPQASSVALCEKSMGSETIMSQISCWYCPASVAIKIYLNATPTTATNVREIPTTTRMHSRSSCCIAISPSSRLWRLPHGRDYSYYFMLDDADGGASCLCGPKNAEDLVQ
jgi:hypothetical protein